LTDEGRQRALRYLAAAASGTTLYFSAPPFKLWPLCFLAAALLAWAVREQRARASFALGLVAAFFYWIFAAPWLVATVTRFTGLPTIAAVVLFLLYCFGQSLMIAIQCAIAASIRTVVGATLAVALSALFCERYVSAVFAWQFAAPLVESRWLPQLADVVTVSGVSALLHACATALVAWASERRAGVVQTNTRRTATVMAALFVGWVGYGAVRSAQFARPEQRPAVRVALLQPAVPPLVRWDEAAAASILAKLHAQTTQAINERPDLIVWHEGAYPYVLPHEASIDGLRAPPAYPVREAPPIVFGLMSAGVGMVRYNGVFLRNEDATLSRPVAKRALVPFGESVPLASTLPWLARLFSQSGGISPGTGSPILRTRSGLALGILICFEDTLAHVAADAADGALIVNLTNDGWFDSPTALEEHLLMARWRSIELRRETVRAVNTGVSGRIDVLGQMATRGPVNREAVLVVTARTWDTRTIAPHFARWGGAIAGLAIAVASAIRWRSARAGRRSVSSIEPAPKSEAPSAEPNVTDVTEPPL
jgi:apolipoprotein N-acyltransferase